MSTAPQPENPTGLETPQGSAPRQPLGTAAFVTLGLLALFLPALLSLFTFMPGFFVGFMLRFWLSGTGGSDSVWPVVLVLITALVGLALLAVLMAFLLRLVRWPRPLGTTLLLLAAPLLAVLQGPALGLWFDSGPGAANGEPIGPVPVDVFAPGMSGLTGYMHLAAVVLPLIAVQLWRPRQARPGRTGRTGRTDRTGRTGLIWASAALALTLPTSTWFTLASLRAEAAEQIQAYTESIEAYPYPLAVLDSPDWRTWHLKFHHEHAYFTVVYINEDDVQLGLTTRPGYGPASDCPAANGPGSPGSSACESFRVEVSGLNDGPSDFAPFETDATVHSSTTRVDLTAVAAEGYEGYSKVSADENAPPPAAFLEPASNPRESFLQGKVPFELPQAAIHEAAHHIRLLSPTDPEAARTLATDAYLAT